MGGWLTRALVTGFLILVPVLGVFPQYRAVVLELSTSDRYVSLVKAIAEDRKVSIDIDVVPAARAQFLVGNNKADIIVPTGRSLWPLRGNPRLDYSTRLFPMAFVLYTHKGKPVDAEDLKAGNKAKAKIEMNVSTTRSFGFTGIPSASPEASLRRVDAGLIDGFIFSQASGDSTLKRLGLKNVHRTLYASIDVYFGVRQGPQSATIDKILTAGVASLRRSGKFDAILGDLVKDSVWNDWQP